MSDHLKTLFATTGRALLDQPDQAQATFAVKSGGQGGLHRRVEVRDFVVDIDEPAALGGTDRAPNPVEYTLAALAACQEITYHMHAAAMGIPLNEVAVRLEGKLDLRGFFAVPPHPRPGFTEIVGSVHIDSPASADQIRLLKEAVDAHCPVLDLLRNATPVTIALA
ncbi:MAG: OsmC family protein [Burkholderiales bacterium]|nr:OsmC family protein [Burkholderiales bacterium]